MDYSVFNGEVKITKKAEQMAEYILSKYTKFNVNGTDYVIDGKPVASSANQLLLEFAGMVNNVRNATPGYTEVFVSDSFVVDHSLYPEYTGAIALTTTLDQRSIDFANYITKIVSLDPATGLVTVNVTVYGLDTEYTAKDLAYIYSHTTADMVFDARYSDMINLICDAILDASAASEVPSIVWNLDGTGYKLSLRSFVPGEGKDCFQQLMAGIYNSINDSPAGFENGWDVPVSAFYDEATGNYVADGYAVLTVPTPDGVRELSLPVHADLTASDYPYNITIPDVDHATIILVPGIDPGKVAIVVIPEDGYEVDSITVTIGDKVIDITDGGVFDLTGDAVVNVKVVKRVTGVTLNRSSATVYQGETFTLTATVLPADATDRSVTWSTSDASVATVSNGVVKAVAPGTAIITVTTVDGAKAATCSVTVLPSVVPVEGVTLNHGSMTLDVGQSSTLTATVSPANATNKSVTWSTSNASVATVSNGVVTAVAPGTAIITVTTVDGGKTATCAVTVVKPVVPVTGVALDKEALSLMCGETATLVATVAPGNATDKSVEWSSSNPAVATVDQNGLVTAVAVGEAVITVKTVDGGKTATCAVTVTELVVPVTGVNIEPIEATVIVGNKVTLTATVMPDNATDKTVTWTSSDASVASVDKNGVVTANAVGTATITVKTVDGDFSAECKITVINDPVVHVTGVTLDKSSASLKVGESVTLNATVLPDSATNKKVTWTSSNTKVITVDQNGVVKAVAPGNATVSVITEDGSHTANCSFTVTEVPQPSSDNTLLYVGIAAAIILIILAAIFLMRRK